MIKAILFDVDGVIIAGRHKYFSQRYSEMMSVDSSKIMPFFKSRFSLCQVGKADLKEELAGYLDEWEWKGTVDELLDFWFKGETDLNLELLKWVKKVREKGTECYLASDQEKYRAKYLMEKLRLGDNFDGCFFSMDLGVTKSEREFFERIISSLWGVKAYEIAYWDDDEKNVAVAGKLGIKAFVYKNLGELEKQAMTVGLWE